MSKKQEYILFIFEGKKTEPLIFENLKKYFLEKKESKITQDIIISYGTVIYRLYKEFFIDDILDEDLDLVTILKPTNKDANIVTRGSVSEIYLFFDYDNHASNADDSKLFKMLDLFNNETEKGKLFISYPMVEALQHIKSDIDFKNIVAKCEKIYKQEVKANCNHEFLHFNDYSINIWNYLIKEHIKKANFIVNDKYEYNNEIIEQLLIFENQKEKYIKKNNKVAVLSSFPLFLLNYYGLDKLIYLLESLKAREERKYNPQNYVTIDDYKAYEEFDNKVGNEQW